MQDSGVPAKFPIPWAKGAASSYIRTVPQASQIGVQLGAASLTDGFPPACFSLISAGGSWPFGQDANGILNQITAWDQWQQAGGPVIYDAAFSTAIGGYPKGSLLMAATYGHLWLSTVDNNTTNPDSGGAGWINPGVNSFNSRTGAVSLSSADVTAALGFTPVQQGTGTGQGANAVKIGWTSAGILRLTVDTTDQGYFAMQPWVTTAIAAEATARNSQIVNLPKPVCANASGSGNVGSNLTVQVSFTAPATGVLHLTTSRNLSFQTSAGCGAGTYLNSTLLYQDSTQDSVSHSYAAVVGAGAYTGSMASNSGNAQQTVYVSMVFIPYT